MKRVPSITNSTYVVLFDGSREAYAYSTAAFRLADSLTPATNDYTAVPAGVLWPLPIGKSVWARGESDTVTIEVSF
jgi:hypothetical protein